MQGERGGAASNGPTASGRMGRLVSQAESVTTTESAVVEPLHPVTLGCGHGKKSICVSPEPTPPLTSLKKRQNSNPGDFLHKHTKFEASHEIYIGPF